MHPKNARIPERGRITMKIGEHNYIQQLQLQNEDALRYVIELYGGLLRSIIRKHLYQIPGRVDECFNDVLLSIWQHIASFDASRSTFKNWAAAVARYRAVDYLREYQKELRQVSLEEAAFAEEDAALEQLIDREISSEMERMLACLDEKDRGLFWKLYVEEMSVEEVSMETGMKKSAIYNHVSRGRRRIRKHFIQEEPAQTVQNIRF